MKKLGLISILAGIIAISVTVSKNELSPAPTRAPASEKMKGHTFKYNSKSFKSNTGVKNSDGEFVVSISDGSYEQASKEALKKCTDHYSDGQGAAVGEDRWLDIIDICVNPY